MSLVEHVFSNRYEIQREIAQGGMAEVYLAHDRLLDRPVALKALFPEYAREPSFVERFRREAQAAANLNDPNIVGIYDWGQETGTYFIVMEYVEGRALRDLIRSEGALDGNQAAEIAAEIASALAFAHRSGVVHRDVKPGNVLLTRTGNVKVTDFGIARAGANDALTQTGSVMGTATYFSPEQAQALPVDGRSDVYSLGVVLYEMVTGVVPFTGDSPVAVAYKHVRETPTVPSQRNPDVPEPLEQIILTALAKDPDDRYQTADDMRADLLRFRRGRPLAAAPVTALVAEVPAVAGVAAAATMQQPAVVAPVDAGPVDEPPGRRRALIIALSVLALVVLAGLIGGFLLLRSDKDQVSVPNVVEQDVTVATQALEAEGFEVEVENVADPAVPVNIVIRQDPAADEEADEGSTVTLTVSAGPETVNVPNVAGSSFEEAKERLEADGFQVARQDEADSNVDANDVIRTDPAADTPAPRGGTVTVFVSTGEEQVTVPDVSGQDADTAFDALANAGLTPREQNEASDDVEEGRVTRTDPAAGQRVARGAQVRLFVSSGQGDVEVPQVVGNTEAEARSALSARGLTASTISQEDAANVGKVISQNPGPGSSVRPGSNVALTIGVAPAATTTTTTTTP
jgi:eukaryotic-like serine/threonine-protein kinase